MQMTGVCATPEWSEPTAWRQTQSLEVGETSDHVEGWNWDEATWYAEADWQWGSPVGVQTQPFGRPSRREWVCSRVLEVLEDRTAELDTKPDGFVSVASIFDADPDLAQKMFYKPQATLRAISQSSQHKLVVDVDRASVRLATLSEQLCALTEALLASFPGGQVLFDVLVHSPAVRQVLAGAAASSSDGDAAHAAFLRETLAGSPFMQVADGVVSRRSLGHFLKAPVERLLLGDRKTRNLLTREVEVPLTWLSQRPSVLQILNQNKVDSFSDVAINALREAVGTVEGLELDEAQISVHLTGALQSETSDRRERARSRFSVPGEKDVRALRQLLGFYFQPFNLQHNSVLMSCVEEQRDDRGGKQKGYLRGSGLRPLFDLETLCRIPRLKNIVEQYEPSARAGLLAAAVKGSDDELPVRLQEKREPGQPLGAWAQQRPALELNYVPNLRFLEVSATCPDAKTLTKATADPMAPSFSLPRHAVSVVSYNVCSDLSNSESPKVEALFEELPAEGLDPDITAWASRRQRFKRQLLYYGVDVICIQGIQSVGFEMRSSETDPSWFSNDSVPAADHFVHMYHDLSPSNYAAVFNPMMQLPGTVLCLGNAVFWKRSRCSVLRTWGVGQTAVCVELSFRVDGTTVVVCSSKSAFSCAREWGDASTDEELVKSVQGVNRALAEALKTGSQPIWCGDFGCSADVVLASLTPPGLTGPQWQNSCEVVLGEVPWTASSPHLNWQSVDLILSSAGFQPFAVVGGLSHRVSSLDLLRAGHPSEHLPQMALFMEERHLTRWEQEVCVAGAKSGQSHLH